MSEPNGVELKIEDGIPVPEGRGRSVIGTTLSKLEVGQSVLIPDGLSRDIGSLAHQLGNRTQRKFKTRTVEGGTRIWRVS